MLRKRNRQNETELLTITIIKLIMENNSFKPGDVVIMKSGSPKMTVSYSDRESTTCYLFLFESGRVSSHFSVPTIILELAPSEV
ncbi:DUF2158 domain-containing protein [Flavobacterium psychrophilum]|nr:DUF2158 domain-containing protein [Flavobacterium psychrophilum]